jgi:GT2 family glycosyltransferase
LVSAIVVNWNRRDLLGDCVASLRHALGRLDEEGELIVVDNASTDRSPDVARERAPDATVIELDANRGFAGGVAEGLRRARGDWILLINNDATVEPDAARELLAVARSGDRIGSVAAQMRFAGETQIINSAGLVIDRLGIAFDRLLGLPPSSSEDEAIEVFGSSGGAGLFSRAMLDELDGFDESFFAFLEDADLAWRARMRGWRSLYAPGAIVHHHHSATAQHGSSRKHFLVGRNRIRLLAKNAHPQHLRRYWPAMLAYDLGYVTFAAVRHRTLAPLRGRLRGLREWKAYRGRGGEVKRLELAPVQGIRRALARNSQWTRYSGGGG